MKATAIHIKDLLEADSSLGLTFADNLFVGREPALPSNTVTILDAIGLPTANDFDADGYQKITIQVRVRNKDYETAFDLSNSIMESLHGRANVTFDDAFYMGIYCISSPVLLDWDGNNRARFITNYLINRRL